MKEVYIKSLAEGERVVTTFMVKFKALPVAKTGRPYITLTLIDRTGEVDGRVWDNAEEIAGRFGRFDIVRAAGIAHSYQGKIQLKLENVVRVDEKEVDMSDYLPVTARNVEEMLAKVRALASSIKDQHLRRIVKAFLDDGSFVEKFRSSAAAKEIHHALIGGLLEHTLSIMELTGNIASTYPSLNRDVLVTGAFLHDIGKVREYESRRAFEPTDEGRLLGHIVIGIEMLDEKIAGLKGFPQDLAFQLKHLIASHHGKLEFGSPRRPKTIEALVLNFADEIDSKINTWTNVTTSDPGEKWTQWNRHFERYLYKGPLYEEPREEQQKGDTAFASKPFEKLKDLDLKLPGKKG